MNEQKKTKEELLRQMHKNNQKLELYKLESDEKGNYLLDPSNPHHREWLENDKDYEVIEQQE